VRRRLELLQTPVLAPLVGSAGVARSVTVLCGVIVAGSIWGVTLWVCPIRGATGVDCPGCGLTRSIALLLRGQWEESMRQHAFGPAALAVGLLFAVSAVLTGKARARLASGIALAERSTAAVPIGLVLLVLYGVGRLV
jgi:hypothetical protein